MRGLRAGLLRDRGCPDPPLPVDALCRRLLSHAFPPHAAIRSQSHIGENGVLRQCFHGVRIGEGGSSRRDAEKPRLRIDRPQAAFRVRLDPGDIVTHGPDLPASNSVRWDQHGEVTLLPQALGNAAATYVSSPAGFSTPKISINSAIIQRLHRGQCSKRFGARSTSCPATHCRHTRSHMTRSHGFPGSERCIFLCCTAT